MSLFAIPFPDIDPVAITFGPFAIRWYGLAYAAGLLLGWAYIRGLLGNARLWANGVAPLTSAQADSLVFWMIGAVVLGGRLGHVLLYEPGYYLQHPLEVVRVWKGGMSFHGALAGSILAILLFARSASVPARSVMDLACAAIPIGVFLGRIANFINSEHWGRTTDAAVGVMFPNGGPLPRHPSQLYEAALEGLAVFLMLRLVTHTWLGLKRPGLVAGAWLVCYALARIICELFREPEVQHALNIGPLTAGQVYSLPMIAFGCYLIVTARRERALETTAS